MPQITHQRHGRAITYRQPLAVDDRQGKAGTLKKRSQFTHVGEGLAYKHGEKLQGFAVAGADQKFHWAEAEIDGDSVVLSSPNVKEPKAIRYAYANKRTWANLFNKNGLPAIPFRTDTW